MQRSRQGSLIAQLCLSRSSGGRYSSQGDELPPDPYTRLLHIKADAGAKLLEEIAAQVEGVA